MTKDDEWIVSVAKAGIKPDPLYTVSEWADKFRKLPPSTSAEHGPWRTARVPYMKAIMDALSPSSPWETVVFMKGSQIAGSEAGYNWLGYIMDVAPGPTLIVMPTLDNMKKISKTRIDPMIAATDTLREKVSEAKSRDSSNKTLLKDFPGGLLAMAGANSPSDLRSMPIRNVFLDEVDAFPRSAGVEGDPVDLAIVRTRNFRNRKIFLNSSPTIAGLSRIEEAYEKTQKYRYHVPCPHCEGLQVLVFQNLRWDKGSPENAYFVCIHCGGIIHNHQKTQMLANGQWIPEITDYKGTSIGFHLSAFYSPVGWLSWGAIAEAWVKAGKDETKLTVIKNTIFGETWKPIGEVPDWERLYNRREKYPRNKVPAGGLVVTAGADVQKDYIQVEAVAWGRGKESWSLDYRVFNGDTADIDSPAWAQLAEFLDSSFPHESGTSLNIKCLAVDTGFNTQTVYSWIRRYPVNRVIPVKGSSTQQDVFLAQPKAVDVYQAGKRSKGAIKLYSVAVNIGKSELYGWLRLPTPQKGEAYSPGFCHFPDDYEEEFFRQIVSEQLQEHQIRGGRKSYEWIKIRPRNEALDCRVYARAASAMLQVDKFENRHWDKIELAVWGDKAPNVPTQPVGATTLPNVQRPAYQQPKGRRVMSQGVRL